MERSGRIQATVPGYTYAALVAATLVATRRRIFKGDAKVAEGKIKRKTDRGFGFIDTGSGKDLFFHMSALEGARFEDLEEGQRVSFTEGQGQKGPCAISVRPI